MNKNLLCLPHAGASAYVYNNWVTLFKSHNINCIFLDYCGHGNNSKTPFSETLELEASSVFAQINKHNATIDAVFGHSMGAIILYELCVSSFGKNNFKPAHLFFSGTSAPNYRNYDSLKNLSDKKELINHLKETKGTPAIFFEDEAVMEYFIPIIQSDYRLIANYVPAPDLPLIPCKATIMYGSEEPYSETDIASWDKVLTPIPNKKIFPGDHFYLHQPSNIPSLVAYLTNIICNK